MTKYDEPVMFRCGDKGEVTAVFLSTINIGYADTITCYSHKHQHHECNWMWFADTEPVLHPKDYRALLEELTEIYKDSTLLVIK